MGWPCPVLANNFEPFSGAPDQKVAKLSYLYYRHHLHAASGHVAPTRNIFSVRKIFFRPRIFKEVPCVIGLKWCSPNTRGLPAIKCVVAFKPVGKDYRQFSFGVVFVPSVPHQSTGLLKSWTTGLAINGMAFVRLLIRNTARTPNRACPLASGVSSIHLPVPPVLSWRLRPRRAVLCDAPLQRHLTKEPTIKRQRFREQPWWSWRRGKEGEAKPVGYPRFIR